MIHILIFLISMFTQDQVQEIEFGNGGGFTGAVNGYVLSANGSLYSENVFTNERTHLKSIDSLIVSETFANVNNSDLLTLELNKPGNMYKYINFNINGVQHKIVWTGKSENKNLNLLYAELMDLHSTKE